MDHSYPYKASLTREPFLFYEMRSTAKLMSEGLSDEAVVTEIVEQNDTVASWSDSTITKLKQIIARVLVETDYLDNIKADHLNPVWLHPVLENAIRRNGDTAVLPAFHCFSQEAANE